MLCINGQQFANGTVIERYIERPDWRAKVVYSSGFKAVREVGCVMTDAQRAECRAAIARLEETESIIF